MGSRGTVFIGVLVVTCAFTSAASASTIDVTTTSDDPVSAGCSLRDAISSANTDSAVGNCAAGSGTDTIVVPAGTYRLTDVGSGVPESNNGSGDLNILKPVTISGAGPAQTTIDGNGTDRVFSVATAAGGSVIDGVTITHGHAPDGNPNASVTVSIDPNTPAVGGTGATGGSGGGVLTNGKLTLSNCVIRNNQAGDGGPGGTAQGANNGGGAQGGGGGTGGSGGGVYAVAQTTPVTLTITGCQITDNSAGAGGTGGIARGGAAASTATGTGGNGGYAIAGLGGTGGFGGGVYIAPHFGGNTTTTALTVTSSVIDNNSAGAGGASNTATGGDGGNTAGPNQTGGQAGTVNSTDPNSAPTGGIGGAGGSGGGIAARALATVTDSDVSGNSAGAGHAGAAGIGSRGGDGGDNGIAGEGFVFGGGGGTGGAGGGIFSTGQLTLTRVGLTGDHAGAGGAGGAATGAAPGGGNPSSLTNQAIAGSGGPGGGGGGLGTSLSQTRSLSDVTVDSSAAGAGGGGGSANAPNGLAAGGAGGAAGRGGGIDSEVGPITLTRTTISANTLGDTGFGGSGSGHSGGTTGADGAPGLGGGIDGANGTAASGTIFAGNDAPQCAGAVGDGGHDIVNPGDAGCPGAVIDPQLKSLADNGGLSPTRAIPASSPAVNAYACTGLDQRGATRPAGANCDIGAYEFAPPAISGQSVDRGDTQVVLHATITPNVSAHVTFTYGRTTSGGTTTPVQTIAGSGPQAVGATITGLSRNTTYHFHVTATNGDGASNGSDVTFTTLGSPPAGGNPSALKLTKLSVNPSTFADAKPHAKRHKAPLGTTIRFTLSAQATVTLTFLRASTGKRARHGRCLASRHTPPRKSRCTRYTRTAALTHTSNKGATKLPFSGLINRHPLPPGTYHLTVAASAGREHAKALTTTLTIVRR